MRNSDVCDPDAWGGGDRQISALTGQTAEPKCWALGSCEKTCLKNIPKWVACRNDPWGQHLGSMWMCMCAPHTQYIHTNAHQKINNDWYIFVYVSMCASVCVCLCVQVCLCFRFSSMWLICTPRSHSAKLVISFCLCCFQIRPPNWFGWWLREHKLAQVQVWGTLLWGKSLSFCMGFLFWVLRACHPLHFLGSAVFPVLEVTGEMTSL